ncbi:MULTISPECIES: aldehyde dehydrogenase family protein [Rhodococcus]|uniref:aldehyde dehydrogenase (NAD(+)) n=1 Tax=Rhodococcus oxybenzonivorans TaxID=1990687 RepID=A0AAE4UWX9_9NOCA|nr:MULTISPECIES: aldehyde dehydrogenase family protein [Rhodococcus]MDV7243642.1 aldehyde dehydrogenase family protein [Rhodococcus oxybenzonivorans]MDV7264295.1 aldehyde dehydrogenase family protein [Rhodococcus oxybenzonivorans]MDV7275116.1 aldehyde dehydrogenase family protein [Rhodococcus oxybenzonivorans]MDV7335354.1 aldehyde dehydrogenase family protein [Rhodococcus oxybenzonivorans]MDV7346065.1 aldehyde dehydrogenase family protein [Rhodococcus oxybenzonivorans]
MADSFDRAGCLIDGDWFVPDGPVLEVIDPYTETVIGEVVDAGAQVIDAAVRSAAAAHPAWRATDVAERAALLDRTADLLTRDADAVAGIVSREMGMPISLAQVTQAQLPADVLRATARTAGNFPWSQDIDGATLVRRGSGVIAAVTPWNMPVHQIVAKVSAALAAGSTVVLKASEMTPYDANALAALFLEAGCPPGVFNVVTGTGAVTGSALVAHPQLAHVSFTGSVVAGRTVASLAAQTLTRCTLELGGKSPAVVLPDADLETALTGVVASGLVNSGQACNATTRLLLPQARAADATDILKAAVAQHILGNPADPRTRQGPLASARQRDRVLDYIGDAVTAGGHLITGTGKPSEVSPTGFFVDPTIVTGLPEDARAIREEIFGPVIAVQTYTDVDDAARIANDCAYGLSAEVWSADVDRARALAGRLDVGQVKINGVRTRNRPTVPFGGVKDSGYGRELGHLGIEEFTDVTAVMS